MDVPPERSLLAASNEQKPTVVMSVMALSRRPGAYRITAAYKVRDIDEVMEAALMVR